MTKQQFRVSRRNVLAGLGTIGVASAGAGLGTTAFFSDTESLDAWLQAGRVDLKLYYRTTYKPWLTAEEANARVDELFNDFASMPGTSDSMGGMTIDEVYAIEGDDMTLHVDSCPALRPAEDPDFPAGFKLNQDDLAPSHQAWADAVDSSSGAACEEGDVVGDDLVDGDTAVFLQLADIKPKDEGETTFCLLNCGNPAIIRMTVPEFRLPENGLFEPEEGAGDMTDGPDAGELAKFIWTRLWFDDGDNIYEEGEPIIFEGSLEKLLTKARDEGIDLPFKQAAGGQNGNGNGNGNGGGSQDICNRPTAGFIDAPDGLEGAIDGQGGGGNNITCEEINVFYEDVGQDCALRTDEAGTVKFEGDGGIQNLDPEDENDFVIGEMTCGSGDDEVTCVIKVRACDSKEDDGDIEIIGIEWRAVEKDDGIDHTSAWEVTGEVDCPIVDVVIIKGGQGDIDQTNPDNTDTDADGKTNSRVYFYDNASDSGDQCLLSTVRNPGANNQTVTGVSNVRFCCDDIVDGNGNGGGGGQGNGECPTDPNDLNCVALQWFLPCYDNPEDLALPSSCFGTMGSEVAKLLGIDGTGPEGTVVVDDLAGKINQAQSDGVHFWLDFEAEQCRHNPAVMPMDPAPE